MVRDDTEHNLKDDFYLDVNYDWLKNTELSEGKKRTGVIPGPNYLLSDVATLHLAFWLKLVAVTNEYDKLKILSWNSAQNFSFPVPPTP